MTDRAHWPDTGTIAGRYRVEQYLARGAMGTVYRVFDESTGRRVALKRHAPVQAGGSTRRKGAAATRQSVANFEREYNTLARLRHPSIIDVYDYGRDAGGPYYTMELLDGQDVRELAPLSPQQACRLLRDIASSLALLHAHRLVHRDVSPRNVRRTAAGRCKLLDFGALAAFGIAPDVVGTPSCVPPEALHGLPLDQRADLYSLGCLAYFLLTGRHAYPARRFDDLVRAWGDKPPSPSALSPNVPRALDELVGSLLSLDLMARPATAAEVIDRLNGIANLEPEERHVAARSYLSSSKTVGRSVELERLGRRLRDTSRVAGGAVLIEGDAGIGKTRLLRELLLEAQLAGATALQVDATDAAEPNAIVRLLGTRLLQANPEAALEAARPHARYLSHALPVARGRLGRQPPASIPDAPGEWRARLQSAFKAWLLEYTGTLPLVVGIDNFDQLDEASAGLLAALVSEASGRELLLVFTARPSSDGEALRAVREAAEVIPLSGLGLEALAELVESLFGDVPNAARLSRWLLRLSGGNPLQCMELVRHLLHEGIIRYAEGTWVLPQDLSSDGLPHSIDDALTSRLARLSAPARALADGLSLARGPLDIEQILRLAELMLGQTRPVSLAALDALLREGVLAGSAEAFRFSHEPLQALVARSIGDARKVELHRQLSRVLLADNSPFAALEAGWHLLVAGDEELAAELLARAGLRVLEETDDLHAAVPALEAALDVYRRRGRPPQELVPLITPLATAAFFVDRHLSARYGPETIAVLRSTTGLALAERLQPLLGRRFAVYAGLAVAWARYKLADRSRRPPSFRAMIVMLLRCATTLAGVASACLDGDGVRRILRVIEPLTVLGRAHPASLIVDYCKSLEAVSSGQFGVAREKLLRLLAILERPADDRTFPDYVRRLFIGGALYALGAVESMRDGPDVLRYADRLGKLELSLYDMVADQLRMLYHAHRGEMRLADVYRKRVETYAMERGSAWQVEVWEPPAMVIVHAREGNLVALRRCTEQLDRLSAEIPSLSRYAALARASYLRLRGRIDEAIALFEGLLAGPDGDRYIGWAPAVGSLASLYNAAGQHARARQVTESLLDTLSPADRPFVRLTLFAQIEHALAVAGLGDVEAAAAELDSLLAEHEPNQGPVTLGCLHEARARVGIAQRDRGAFAHHWARMEHWFRRTENPALIGACERLAAEGVRTGTISAPAEALPSHPVPRRGVATLRRLRRD